MKIKDSRAPAAPEKASAEEAKRRNLEHYGLKIKSFRLRAGLSADELADRLQISKSSVRNWECGLTRPDPELLYRIFGLLDVEPNEFFGVKGVGTLLTSREQELVSLFRSLDSAGREDALAVLEALSSVSERRRLLSALERMIVVPDAGRLAAAGDGAEWEEHPEAEQVILYRGAAVSGADEVVTVTGRSMEPLFTDGDRVLVKRCTGLKDGETGVFFVPGMGGVIKQKGPDGLRSVNPDFGDIIPGEEGAAVIGRVIGRLEPEMVPSPEEQALYREALRAGL